VNGEAPSDGISGSVLNLLAGNGLASEWTLAHSRRAASSFYILLILKNTLGLLKSKLSEFFESWLLVELLRTARLIVLYIAVIK
jgi:hypothetical protein